MTDSRTHVVFVLPSFAGGGAEHVMLTIANNLDTTRFRPSFIVFDNSGAFVGRLAPHIPLYTVGSKRLSRGIISYWRLLKTLRPDVLFTTMAHLNFITLLVCRMLPPCRLIIREAITPDFFFARPQQGFIVKWAYKLLYPYASHITAPTTLALTQLEKLLGRQMPPSTHIMNPVDVSACAQGNTDAQHEASNIVRFVACGRLDYQKGFDRLIHALSAWQDNTNWHLDIYGDGPERETLENLIEQHHLKQHVSLKGFSNEARAAIGKADCFLLPSRFEGLPNVVLEALARGTPCISHQDAGGVLDIVTLAQPQALYIAQDMDEFLRAMARTAHKTNPSASLLVADLAPKTITALYERLFST